MPPTDVRDCRDLATKREAFAVFRRWRSPQLIALGLTVAMSARLIAGHWTLWDLPAAAVVFVITPFTEWAIHLHLFHADPRSLPARHLGVGSGHRRHHLDPGAIEWLLLTGADAAVFQLLVVVVVVAITVPPLWLLGAPPAAPALSAAVLALTKLLEYEWDHFLFHTAYRPRTRWYRRLERNHRLHHWRNENYWLGVTVNLGDRLLRTYPRTTTDVPMSATARTLDPGPES
ncbi:MAG: sterol desaturase family protein [Acidimicrobiales bacterium]